MSPRRARLQDDYRFKHERRSRIRGSFRASGLPAPIHFRELTKNVVTDLSNCSAWRMETPGSVVACTKSRFVERRMDSDPKW